MATDEQKDRSLLEFLDTSQLNCLNEAAQHPLKPILEGKVRNTTDKYLLSDADDQLLLNVHFNQPVRVRSVAIAATNVSQAPKRVKLMVNRSSIGFEDVEDAVEPAVAQILDLTEEQVEEGQKIALRFVRFQNVNSLHIFVESNQGEEDKTRIDSVDIFGTTIETTRDLRELKSTKE
ncbi:hypothetical protein Ac2012v2_001587 [Leucoagaricus gongylophorus]